MITEVEVKFLHTNHDQVRSKLKELGADCVTPMRLMRRVIMDFPDGKLHQKRGYVRIRDEGDKISLTYKQFDDLSIDGAKEIEVIVNEFSTCVHLCETLGLVQKSMQESKRETWKLDTTEIVLDEWPWLDPYIEIESTSEEDVRHTASLMGFEWDNAVFGDVMVAYKEQYPNHAKNASLSKIKEVRFNTPLPAMFAQE